MSKEAEFRLVLNDRLDALLEELKPLEYYPDGVTFLTSDGDTKEEMLCIPLGTHDELEAIVRAESVLKVLNLFVKAEIK